LKRIKGIFNYNSICEFYTKITQYLGMKPMSHEYKIMGMAPYADERYRAELLNVFRTFYRISENDSLTFINTSGRWKWQFLDLFKALLFEIRFDNISGAVQDLFEEVILAWVRNAIEKTGVHDLALSGGGFMNVKLNGKILELPEVKSLFIFPSCGDESNPVGAAILSALDKGYSYKEIESLKINYWGPQFTNADIKRTLDDRLPQLGFRVSYQEEIDKFVADKLAAGQIVGRLTGRMEWGARALGNRSIVADPRSTKVIQRINKAIKMRDFWMPFAPAILKEYRKKYLSMRDDFHCPFMTMASKTTSLAFQDIAAGLHPFDLTARPQIVDPENHPSFYQLISEYEKITGVGGLLNTSFNLHGEPVVCNPEDAIHTLLESDLDGIQLENYYVERIR
jgi:carbamoyltransferase